MSNRTELRTRLRQELGDTGTVTVWSDGLLDNLLVEAGSWYSRLWPRQTEAYREVASGQRTFDLPPGVLGLVGVECPPGGALPQEAEGVIGTPPSSGIRQSWSVWGDVVYLGRAASGDEVGATHLVMRLLMPWDRLDPVEPWNGPEEDERLLVLWAATEAWAWLDGEDQKRGRPARSGAMTKRYAAQLEQEVAARRRAASSRRLVTG
ncbi:MAG: hypothetical protein ABI670_19450 [Chloroflexota bacterium]